MNVDRGLRDQRPDSQRWLRAEISQSRDQACNQRNCGMQERETEEFTLSRPSRCGQQADVITPASHDDGDREARSSAQPPLCGEATVRAPGIPGSPLHRP